MPNESLNSFFPGYSRYIAIISPPGFINQENKIKCYFNATIKLLNCNFICGKLILSIDCYTMMIILDKNKL